MKVPEEALVELEALWREDHPNLEIDRDRLSQLAAPILRAVEAVYQPIHSEKAEAFRKINGVEHLQTDASA